MFREHGREHACDNISNFSDLKANFPQADFSITDSGMHQSEAVDGGLIQLRRPALVSFNTNPYVSLTHSYRTA